MSKPHFWAIAVTDLGLADWYARVLDLAIVARLEPAADGSHVVVLRGHDLLVEMKRRESHVERAEAADGYFKVGWFVPSLVSAQEALTAGGAVLVAPPIEQPELGIRFCMIADPEGNLIQLFEQLSVR